MHTANQHPLQSLSQTVQSDQIIVQGKTAQIALLLGRCREARKRVSDNKPGRDAVQALLSNLHFGDLVDAVETLFAERVRLESVFKHCTPIETVDDVDVIEQYLDGLRHTNEMSKLEIARLMGEGGGGGRGAQEGGGGGDKTPPAPGHDKEVQADDGLAERNRELSERLIAEIKSLKEAHRGQQERLTSQLSEQLQTIRSLEQELKHANAKVGLLKEELDRMEKSNDMRLKETAFLKKELDKSQSRNDNFAKSTGDPLHSALKELRGALAAAEQEKTLWMAKCKEHEDRIGVLQQECSRLASQAEQTSRKSGALCCDAQRRELESCRKTLTVAKEELLGCRDQLYELKKQIVNQEYLRNVVVSFLSTPGQRPHMLAVLCRLLDLTDAEMSKVNVSLL